MPINIEIYILEFKKRFWTIPMCIICLTFSACNSFYKPTMLNVPLHDKAGDIQISGAYGYSGGELHLSGAITNHVYLSANGQILFKKTKEDSISLYRSMEFALGYYRWLDKAKKVKLDLACGYGPGDIDYRFLIETIPMQLRFHVSSKYHKIYLQPSLGFNSHYLDFAISMKGSMLYHYDFTDYYNPKMQLKSFSPIGYLEPVLTIKKGLKNLRLVFQTGLVWPLTPRHALARPIVFPYTSIGFQVKFNPVNNR